MDLFSTRANMKLPIYVSPFPDLLVREEDAFQHQWDKLSVCVFTSFTLLRQFLSRGKLSCNLSMNLVAPFWSQKGVVCTFLVLLVEEPLKLFMLLNLLVQPHLRIYMGAGATVSVYLEIIRYLIRRDLSKGVTEVIDEDLRISSACLYQGR